MALTLNNFAPIYGTTKVVLLTKKERNEIGRKKLATYVADCFPDGSTVAVKSYGQYFRVTNHNERFEVRGSGGLFNVVSILFDGGHSFVEKDFFVNWLSKLNSCVMLRMLKLIEKNARDKESQRIQKELTQRQNYILLAID